MAKKATTETATAAPLPETLQPLDLSPWDKPDDSPELAEFKKNVEKVARKYAKRHDWCSVVDTALHEMGVTAKNVNVTVAVTSSFGPSTRVSVPLGEVKGKTLAQQVKAIADQMGYFYFGNERVPVTPALFATIEAIPPETPLTIPAAEQRWYLTSNTGRVLHLMRERGEDGHDPEQAVCGVYLWRFDRVARNVTAIERRCARCVTRSA